MSKRICFLLALMALAVHADLKLEGLVYETEDWSEPKDAWQKDVRSPNKWNLWTTEEDIEAKRSRRASLQSPHIAEDRQSPEDGAPPLHTKITGIPNGWYHAYMGRTNRYLGISFDGVNWQKSDIGETFLGFYDIKDGVFELWADDCYATPGNLGTAYYDYIRFVPVKEYPKLYELKSFTLPDGRTQLSWISSTALAAATVEFGIEGQPLQSVKEEDDNMRNHAVVLPPLTDGAKYTAIIKAPVRRVGVEVIESERIAFVAGERPRLAKSQAVEIPLTIHEPTGVPRESWPVVSGVPFAQGVLASENDMALLDAAGQPVPAEFTITSRWPDGSARWATVLFMARTNADDVTYTLKIGENLPKPTVQNPQNLAAWVAGVANYLQQFPNNLLITLESGEPLVAENFAFTLGENTALRATGILTCDLTDESGEAVFRFKMNLAYYGNRPNGLWNLDYSLTNVDFKNLNHLVKSVVLQVKTGALNKFVATADGNRYDDGFEVTQFVEKEAILTAEDRAVSMEHFDGFMAFGPPIGNLFAVQIHDFWQTYPKALKIDNEFINISLLPQLPAADYPPADLDADADAFFLHYYWYKNGCYVWKQGLEVQQRISWMMIGRDANLGNVRDWIQQPLFAQASPEYYCKTMAFSNIEPASPNFFPEYDATFDASFKQLEEGRVKRGEYGWLNYGDWFGERKWNWGDNEYDLTYSCAVQFARTGRLDYLERARQMVRHYTTVDILHWPPSMVVREPIYEHCCGHVGDYITRNAPVYQKLGKNNAILGGAHDGTGGHALHVGMYLMANLLGEPHYADVAYACSWNQSKRYTPNYRFTIERTVGWAIINNMYAYSMTNNPYFLNACKIFFEAVKKQQNQQTGCFDLPQDQSECDCPDKAEHRGGKPFATGVLMHGLIRLYEATGDPEVKDVIVKIVDWLLDTAWNPRVNGWRYKTGCPKYANGGSYSILTVEGITYASILTGNPKYAQFVADTIGKSLRKNTGTGYGCGKSFTQLTRQTSHALYNIHKQLGITSTQVPEEKKEQK